MRLLAVFRHYTLKTCILLLLVIIMNTFSENNIQLVSRLDMLVRLFESCIKKILIYCGKFLINHVIKALNPNAFYHNIVTLQNININILNLLKL